MAQSLKGARAEWNSDTLNAASPAQDNVLPFLGCSSIFFSACFQRKPWQRFAELRNRSLVIPPASEAGLGASFLLLCMGRAACLLPGSL